MTGLSHTVTLATESEAHAMGRAMARAFQGEPNFEYMIPDERKRAEAFAWFFGVFVARLGFRYGRVYTTTDAAGGAVWTAPGRKVTMGGALRAGLLAMPVHFGWGGLWRSMRVNQRAERMRDRCVPDRHWYLMALGVDPSAQRRGIGAALAEADATGTACYLETFNERNVSFYQRLGFHAAAEDRITESGPRLWGMVREPRT